MTSMFDHAIISNRLDSSAEVTRVPEEYDIGRCATLCQPAPGARNHPIYQGSMTVRTLLERWPMRLRVQTESFTTVLLAALGLSPIGACGGAFATDSSDAGALGSGGGQAGSSSTTGGAGDIGGNSGVGGDTYPDTGGYIGQGGAVVGAGGATPYSCFSGGYAGSGPGLLTGYDRCGNSMIHRTIKKDCASGLPRDIVFQVDGGVSGPGTCLRDADCTAKPHGYCAYPEAFGGPVPPGGLSASCYYGCVRDEECGQSQICMCGGGNVPAPIGHCVSSTCTNRRAVWSRSRLRELQPQPRLSQRGVRLPDICRPMRGRFGLQAPEPMHVPRWAPRLFARRVCHRSSVLGGRRRASRPAIGRERLAGPRRSSRRRSYRCG